MQPVCCVRVTALFHAPFSLFLLILSLLLHCYLLVLAVVVCLPWASLWEVLSRSSMHLACCSKRCPRFHVQSLFSSLQVGWAVPMKQVLVAVAACHRTWGSSSLGGFTCLATENRKNTTSWDAQFIKQYGNSQPLVLKTLSSSKHQPDACQLQEMQSKKRKIQHMSIRKGQRKKKKTKTSVQGFSRVLFTMVTYWPLRPT